MTRSMELAGLEPKDIDHVNAHATATPIGDTAEANAIRVAGVEHAAGHQGGRHLHGERGEVGHAVDFEGPASPALTVLLRRQALREDLK